RNFANSGGGILIVPTASGGASAPVVTLQNTIVASNFGRVPDIDGAFTSRGNNLVGDSAQSSIDANRGNASYLAPSDLRNIDPRLAELAPNGGPTQPLALFPASPAINAGNTAGVPAGLTTDQRGLPRVCGGAVDIGAFESQPQTVGTYDPATATWYL